MGSSAPPAFAVDYPDAAHAIAQARPHMRPAATSVRRPVGLCSLVSLTIVSATQATPRTRATARPCCVVRERASAAGRHCRVFPSGPRLRTTALPAQPPQSSSLRVGILRVSSPPANGVHGRVVSLVHLEVLWPQSILRAVQSPPCPTAFPLAHNCGARGATTAVTTNPPGEVYCPLRDARPSRQ